MKDSEIKRNKKKIRPIIFSLIFLFTIIYSFTSFIYSEREESHFTKYIVGSYSFSKDEFNRDYSKINLNDSKILNEYFSIPHADSCFFKVEVSKSINYYKNPSKELYHEYSFNCKNNKSSDFKVYFLSSKPSDSYNGNIRFSYSTSFDSTFAKNETLYSYSKKDLEKFFGAEDFQLIREEIKEKFKTVEAKKALEKENLNSWK